MTAEKGCWLLGILCYVITQVHWILLDSDLDSDQTLPLYTGSPTCFFLNSMQGQFWVESHAFREIPWRTDVLYTLGGLDQLNNIPEISIS